MSIKHTMFKKNIFKVNGIGINRISRNLHTINNSKNYLIAIPITNKESFIYYKSHKDNINKDDNGGNDNTVTTSDVNDLNKKIKLMIQKSETKLNKLWTNFKNSKNSINVYIMKIINKFLNNIPWEENVLKSFSDLKLSIDINNNKDKDTEKINTKDSNKILNLYYPSELTNQYLLKSQLIKNSNLGKDYHLKYLIISILSLPLTIPFILVPILPNIPGFYLLYRSYCHYKAYKGSKILNNLLKNDKLNNNDNKEINSITDNNKNDLNYIINYIGLDSLSHIYVNNHSNTSNTSNVSDISKEKPLLLEDDGSEHLVLNNEIIEELTGQFELEDIKDTLKLAVKQKSKFQ